MRLPSVTFLVGNVDDRDSFLTPTAEEFVSVACTAFLLMLDAWLNLTPSTSPRLSLGKILAMVEATGGRKVF